MINEAFGLIARIFPGLVFLTFFTGLAFLARAWSRMSSGSVGAGPALIPNPQRAGLQQVPWELHGVTQAIAAGSNQPVDLLLKRAESLGIDVNVPDGAPPQRQLDSVLDQLEAALSLPPLPYPVLPTAAPNAQPKGTP